MPSDSGASSFFSDWSKTRVIFGADAVSSLAREMSALGISRPLLVTTPGRAAALPAALGDLTELIAGICDIAATHVPGDRVQQAVAIVDDSKPGALLAVGGGSAIGLAKAVALVRRLPILAVPTTYAGSEMTGIWGITQAGRKQTGRDPEIAPRLVIYDPVLTLSLPAAASAASGMNAVAHAVEALYAKYTSPIAGLAAEEALRTLARALPEIVARPDDLDARTRALRGAHAAGVALNLAAMGLHHRICHVLGGSFGLPHAETHAAVLPHAVSFNTPAAPEAMARIAAAIGADDAAVGLAALNKKLGLTMSLQALGLRHEDLGVAADLIVANAYANPRPATAGEIRGLLERAM
jgi:maleylacetate reductase